MSRVNDLKADHTRYLEDLCIESYVEFSSLQNLLEAERTKKLLKRNALIQQNIDKEIDNALDNES
jgi:hypothetical protein